MASESDLTRHALNQKLIAAHECDDKLALMELYLQAANQSNDQDAACFYLTHAYIFALDVGSIKAGMLHARLKSLGREE